jgi:CRP/FNR family transcriptional regulator, cyclic AMP receptor protein
MPRLDESNSARAHICNSGRNCFQEKLPTGRPGDPCRIGIIPNSKTKCKDVGAMWRSGEFCKCLPPQALGEFETLAAPFRCEKNALLLSEGEESEKILLLLDGRVKLSINSLGGKRLVLGIAEPGDIVGLAAAVSGQPSEMTAEAQVPCCFASIPRARFLDFLLRYPIASYSIGRQLGVEYKRACDELRLVGFSVTASIKLARLLVEWCAGGIETDRGVQIHCSLTNEEIGEYIGVGRETVSRTLTDFRIRQLVHQHGSTMFVTSLPALELFARPIDC